ncbi:hypothetical protein [Kitasatospora sp. MBT63]|uniref:hypothetical protein n=1 Tax=Kitasatospora sp. MBT63 TaxID=1444768 RepID=UPI000539CB2C|nr:hypothetical protein [Kitasatospora sp. MBT63]
MKIPKRFYVELAVLALVGVSVAVVPGVIARHGCAAGAELAGSAPVREFTGTHPGTVPAGEPSPVTCNEDGCYAHAGAEYHYQVPEREIVDYYTRTAESLGWVPDREGEQVPPEVAGFCFSRDVEGRPVMVVVRFDSVARTYQIRSEVALDGTRNRCWL